MYVGLTLAGCHVPSKPPLSLPSTPGQGRENKKKRLMSWDEDSQKSLIDYQNRQKRFNLGKLILNLITNQNQSSTMRSRANLKTPHFVLLPSSTSSPTVTQGGWGRVGATVSSVVSAAVQGEESFPCSSLGSLPQKPALHELLQCETILTIVIVITIEDALVYEWWPWPWVKVEKVALLI